MRRLRCPVNASHPVRGALPAAGRLASWSVERLETNKAGSQVSSILTVRWMSYTPLPARREVSGELAPLSSCGLDSPVSAPHRASRQRSRALPKQRLQPDRDGLLPEKDDVHDSSPGSPAGAGAGPADRVDHPQGGGWLAQLGLEITSTSATEVLAEWSISERHLQPHGIVHGGVYASVVETCCSLGAAAAAPAGKRIVGVENHTSFLRPVRTGRLHARARPLHAGRQAQLWECAIVDEGERLIATGRLRVFCVDAPVGAQT